MQSFIRLKLDYSTYLLVPVKLSAKLFEVLKESHVVSSEYRKGGGLDYTVKSIEQREIAFQAEYIELPNEASLDPLNEWHKVLDRCNKAEAELEKHKDLIATAQQLDPNTP